MQQAQPATGEAFSFDTVPSTEKAKTYAITIAQMLGRIGELCDKDPAVRTWLSAVQPELIPYPYSLDETAYAWRSAANQLEV